MKTRLQIRRRVASKEVTSKIQTRLQRRTWQTKPASQSTEKMDLQAKQAKGLGYNFSQIPINSPLQNPYLAAKKKTKVSAGTYKYEKIKGKAFVKDNLDPYLVDPDDVKQGSLGDCYLLAGMAAVARANPGAIEKLIKDQHNGIYDVTIYVDTAGLDYRKWGPFKIPIPTIKKVPKVIRVNDTFPVSQEGEAAFARTGDISSFGPELWVMLIEKAYAIHMGGYDKIEGGNPGIAMEYLTGNRSKNYKTNRYSDKQIASIIDQALKHQLPITTFTPDFSRIRDGKKVPTALGEEAERKGLVGNHAYAPSRISESSIDLQNPWGKHHIKGLSISDFKKFFPEFQINS